MWSRIASQISIYGLIRRYIWRLRLLRFSLQSHPCKTERNMAVSSDITRTTSGSYLLFFFPSSLLNNPCKRTSGRPVFEYAGYYENGEHDNHERFPDVRTMSSPRFWTGANGNKTGPERHYRHREYPPLSTSAVIPPTDVFHNLQ